MEFILEKWPVTWPARELKVSKHGTHAPGLPS